MAGVVSSTAATVEGTLVRMSPGAIRGVKKQTQEGSILPPVTTAEGDTKASEVVLTETAMEMMLHENGGVHTVRAHETARVTDITAHVRRKPRSGDAPTALPHHHRHQNDLELL